MDRVGRYQLLEKLGEGGMGVVYKAYDPLIQRIVAVKQVSGSVADGLPLRERFFAEARAAGHLSHRNIVTIYDLGEEGGQPFFAMEFLEGRDLGRAMRSGEPMTLARRIDVIAQAGHGLSYAHSRGVIHRDVKPANIFITLAGDVKVLDFGLARVARPHASGLTRTRAFVGTVSYMAPEQIRGEPADARTDLFALGVVLYELLSGGRRAFETDSFASTLHRILTEEPEPLGKLDAGLPPALIAIVNRTIAKRREERYQTVDEMLEDLAAFRATLAEPEPVTPSRPPTPRFDSLAGTAVTVGDDTPLDPRTPPLRTPPPRQTPYACAPPQPVAAQAEAAPAHPRRRPLTWIAGALLLVAVLGAGLWSGFRADNTTARSTTHAGGDALGPPGATGAVKETAAGTTGVIVGEAETEAPVPAETIPPAPAAAGKPGGASPARARQAARVPSRQPAPGGDDRLRVEAQTALVEAGRARGRAEAAGAERLAAVAFAAALEAEETAGRQLAQGDYRQARAGWRSAGLLFARAESEARAEAARRAEQDRRQDRAEAPPSASSAPPPVPPPPEAPPVEGAPGVPVVPGAFSGAGEAGGAGAAAERVIAELLGRYTEALESRAMARLKRVWPGLGGAQERAIAEEFRNARAIAVSLSDVTTDVTGDNAKVTCRRWYRLETQDGQRLESDTRTVFALRRAGNEWVIDHVRHEARR
ncbi:MAG TPA: protein kinase [Vicinamibacterales bacterium]|nr:protein kinase [Vicinamibacterales bacterium]